MGKVIAKVLDGNDVLELEGTVKEITDDNVVLVLTEGGEVTIAKDDLLEPLTDVVLELPEIVPEVAKVEEKVVVVVVNKKLPALKAGSKLAQVVELCKANPGKSRKELIGLIVETGIMTSLAGASTYHQNAKPYLV